MIKWLFKYLLFGNPTAQEMFEKAQWEKEQMVIRGANRRCLEMEKNIEDRANMGLCYALWEISEEYALNPTIIRKIAELDKRGFKVDKDETGNYNFPSSSIILKISWNMEGK